MDEAGVRRPSRRRRWGRAPVNDRPPAPAACHRLVGKRGHEGRARPPILGAVDEQAGRVLVAGKVDRGLDAAAAQCQDTHVGYTASGHLVAELSDGTRLESGPGSVFVIPAGHDAWVAGDEPCVIVQFDEGESAARHFDVAGATAKAG